MNLNVTVLFGHLVRDPDVKIGPSGVVVARIEIAANRKYTDRSGNPKEEVAFVDGVVFGPPAEWARGYHRGDSVLASGRLRTDKWEHLGKPYSRLVLVVEEIKFFQRPDRGAPPTPAEAAEAVADNVPF